MTDRTFVSLAPKLYPSVPNAPQQLVLEAVRDSAIRTCERTLAWKYIPASFALTPSTAEYSWSTYVPAGSTVTAIDEAFINDSPLKRVSYDTLRCIVPDWTSSSGSPSYISEVSYDKFITLPTPDAVTTYTMRLHLALKPTRSATGFDQVFFNDLEEIIMHGALQHLLVLPGVAWTDRELAAYHAKQYVYRVNERRARVANGVSRASQTVQPNPLE